MCSFFIGVPINRDVQILSKVFSWSIEHNVVRLNYKRSKAYFSKIIYFFYYISYIRQRACHLRKFMIYSIFFSRSFRMRLLRFWGKELCMTVEKTRTNSSESFQWHPAFYAEIQIELENLIPGNWFSICRSSGDGGQMFLMRAFIMFRDLRFWFRSL